MSVQVTSHSRHTTVSASDFTFKACYNVSSSDFTFKACYNVSASDLTFKVYYNVSASDVMVSQPGKQVTINKIAQIVGNVYPLAFTITSGIKVIHVIQMFQYQF